jgi:acetyl esterase/lipase
LKFVMTMDIAVLAAAAAGARLAAPDVGAAGRRNQEQPVKRRIRTMMLVLCAAAAGLILAGGAAFAAAAEGPATTPAGAGPAATDKGQVVPLWPKDFLPAPATGKVEKAEKEGKGDWTIIKVADVSTPTLTVFPAPASAAGGAAAGPAPAVIVCPGGGYYILAWDLEGTEIAQWLSASGVTCVLLKYRVPGQREQALQDGQRAVSLTRANAKAWNIDPARIGILGFSAGGHLAARVGTDFAKRSYKPTDADDEQSCRPDFTVLIYPAYLLTKDNSAVDTAALPIGDHTPPTFLAIAADDKLADGAMQYFQALRKAKVPAELHVYQFGGHGCGLRPRGANVTDWPQAAERWMRGLKVLPAAPAPGRPAGL